MTTAPETYCCAMRRHFLVGILGARADEPVPIEAGEFVADFEAKPMVVRIKFCPFCGAKIDAGQTLRTVAE